jgi:hypothetical protein
LYRVSINKVGFIWKNIERVNQPGEIVAIAEVVTGVRSIEGNKTYLLILKDVRLLISVEDTKEREIEEVA